MMFPAKSCYHLGNQAMKVQWMVPNCDSDREENIWPNWCSATQTIIWIKLTLSIIEDNIGQPLIVHVRPCLQSLAFTRLGVRALTSFIVANWEVAHATQIIFAKTIIFAFQLFCLQNDTQWRLETFYADWFPLSLKRTICSTWLHQDCVERSEISESIFNLG